MNTDLEIRPTLADYPIVEDYYDLLLACDKTPFETLSKTHRISPKDLKTIIEKDENKRYLAKKVDSYFKLADFDRIKVMEELKHIAFANFSDILTFDGDEVQYKDWQDLSKEVLASISEVKQTKNNRDEVTIQIKQHNKMDALKTLSNILKMQENTLRVEGTVVHKHRLFDNVFDTPLTEAINADFTAVPEDQAAPIEPDLPDTPPTQPEIWD